ncbi:MAG TPA: hypothetical protein DCZ84_02470 [Candidatus Vogelbacteria bacterium]|uniref:DUF8128 domain-containing protein n=1 Tax=Candidatus Vogelbacteria bacterium RIFOXYD1_FULL_51_18 TaxID=1802440 RepID=A0A1G2QNG2_9BACT|nr:MAG: hypothetical protein UY66_C0020G0008 [Parcubacteria group bacterium GW2011_GWC1_51_35]KKW24349.1 MAG: hypothetical protein UY68_C0011G0010 [Parcubacteria group bacterium GW2011_GWF2_52_12]KKW27058.1 MAG: hypothetical protein UY69_C0016G0013 [Parcubacteria group bacterium GW2011_GWF1_52_5]KKW38251.1 MAG: hypothetical protein UY88_C0016G0011 [Parcubacteria group bacterium GW2011_GWA1_54_88]OHA61542.1 MAG: hypothetical protein A2569_03465 [Candidatus Vogelbacteria bacterium RIFOXYD1_FULL_5
MEAYFFFNLNRFFILVLPYAWYWFPPALALILWHSYRYYTLQKYLAETKWITLEIKIPREVTKSPQAMELALAAFHQTRDLTWYQRTFTGYVRPWFSLEMVSIGGVVHFFVHTPAFFKNVIESSIYAQYPEVEIYETEDYVHDVPMNAGQPDSDWDLWGATLELTKADPYPIKTYIDYGLDKDPKEEFKNDPLATLIELLGSLKQGERFWAQVLVQATRKRFPKTDGPKSVWAIVKHLVGFREKQDWQDEGKALINKLMKRDEKPKLGEFKFTMPSSVEDTASKAIARSISKQGYDCGIRLVYTARRDAFNPSRIVGGLAAFKQFSSLDLNGFKPKKTTKAFNYPWQDPWGWRELKLKKRILRAYRERGWFYSPYKILPFVLNTEELATIFHFPGSSVETPTFGRIESRRGEPPPNLPL